jgi:methionyl-tRNA synthetase
MTSTYLTVAIPYVNAAPHLGYAYELVLADIAARARRARPDGQVRFLGGTDDYSLKNVLAAEEAGIPTAQFVAQHAQRFARLSDGLGISFDDFIQTSSDPRHQPAVVRLWERISARGDLYRKSYSGQYCVDCEQFYTNELIDRCCPEHRTRTETLEETNWFFRLSAYRDRLERAISTGELDITPSTYRTEVLAFVRAGLQDLSVSRSAQRARGWGVPVPGDPDQVIYVWFDALANYISALDYGQPGSGNYRQWWTEVDHRMHVIGKGILRFHAVYWPAFLASAAEPAPTRIHVHPYLSIEGAKLSKSSGITVDPVELAGVYGVDALRWWFARDVQSTTDTDFSIDRLVETANQDLAGGFANVISRVTSLIHRYRDGVVPNLADARLPAVNVLAEAVHAAVADFDLPGGTQLLLDAVAAVNRDLEVTTPWRLAKDPSRSAELDAILVRHVSRAAEIAEALAPIIPGLAHRLSSRLARPGQPLPPQEHAFSRLVCHPTG